MTELQKRELFTQEMLSRGVKKAELHPPLFRLAWALGFRVPPPYYASGGQQFLVYGVGGGLFWGIFMWLLVWRDSPGVALCGGLFFGLMFAFIMHFHIEKCRKKLGIKGLWNDYQPPKVTEAEKCDASQ